MSGWEAMQQGAPDPFFAEQREPLCALPCVMCVKAGECLCPPHKSGKEPQILGSGRDDFRQCADCAWDICGQAKACLRQRTQT
jgi:hypothetical protein